MKHKRFWWVRHAPVIGTDGKCYGNNEVDCDLSDKKSFSLLAKFLPKNPYVYTSTLTRTINTFHATCDNGLIYSGYKKMASLTEQNLGEWAGLTYSDLELLTKKLSAYDPNWLCAPHFVPPNGESYNQLYKRVILLIKQIILEEDHQDLVIFSHGGPIRAAIALAMNTDPSASLPFNIDNLSVSRLDFVSSAWCIKFVNLNLKNMTCS